MSAVHAFTVDVEDWYHGVDDEAMRRGGVRRLAYGLDKLLDLLARFDAKATFFWLGAAAAENPALVRKVAAAGHELGCHGHEHRHVHRRDAESFLRDTQTAVDVLQQLSGARVLAYRAPYFSINDTCPWALEVLVQAGFRYDSSLFPARRGEPGNQGGSPHPYTINTPSGPLIEAPLSLSRIGPWSVPSSGGGYFRLYPYWLTRRNFMQAEREQRFVNFYIHPWELDPARPRGRLPWRETLKNAIGKSSVESRLEALMADFKFMPLGSLVETGRATAAPVG